MEHLNDVSGPASVSAVGAGKSGAPAHADIVLIIGPDVEDSEHRLIDRACTNSDLSINVIDCGKSDFTSQEIAYLHRSGALGPNTHMIVSGHGSIDPDEAGASTSHSMMGWQTDKLIDALRTHPDEAQSPQENPPWRGMIHLLACKAGHLRSTLTPQNPAWKKGPCLIHANSKSNTFNMVEPHISQLIQFLGDRKQRKLGNPDPLMVLAEVGAISGESVTLLGGALLEPQIWRAPKNRDEAILAYNRAEQLKLELESKLESSAE